MKDNAILKNNFKSSFWDYVVLIFAILSSATPIQSLYYTQTNLAFFVFAFLYFLVNKVARVVTIQKIKLVFLFTILSLIYITLIGSADSDVNFYLGLSTVFIASFFIVETMGYERFCKVFINTFVFITIYSVVLTVLIKIIPSFLTTLEPIYEPGGQIPRWRTFHYFYFVWDLYQRNKIIRNAACFREPGVWGSFVLIAIIMKMSIILKDKANIRKRDFIELIILFIGAASSLSTSTIICLFILLVVYFFNSKHTRKQLLLFLGVIGICFVGLLLWGGVLFSKFDVDSTSYKSLFDRIVGISDSFNCWKQSPILGVGYTKYFEVVTLGVNTVSYLYVLGAFGPGLLLAFLFALWCWSEQQSFTKGSIILVFLVISIILNTQNLIFYPLIVLLMFYGVKGTIKTKSIKFSN